MRATFDKIRSLTAEEGEVGMSDCWGMHELEKTRLCAMLVATRFKICRCHDCLTERDYRPLLINLPFSAITEWSGLMRTSNDLSFRLHTPPLHSLTTNQHEAIYSSRSFHTTSYSSSSSTQPFPSNYKSNRSRCSSRRIRSKLDQRCFRHR